MPRISNDRKEYVLLKIKNLDGLIANATSDAQKELYEAMRQIFIAELPKKDNPDLLEEQRQKLIMEEQAELERKIEADKKLFIEKEKERQILEAKEKEKERVQALKDKKAELEKQLEEFDLIEEFTDDEELQED